MIEITYKSLLEKTEKKTNLFKEISVTKKLV